MVYYNLAKNQYKIKEYKQSEILLDSAKTIINKIGTDYGLGDIYNLYGQLYLEQNKFPLSEDYFNQSLAISLKSDTAVPSAVE